MKKLIFAGPVLTASGYGEHSRQLLKSLLKSGKFDVSVVSLRWGETPFLSVENDEFLQKIAFLARKFEIEKQSNVQYDISVQVTIPNEFQKMAKVNVCVTAGIEVDRVSPEWINKTNEVADVLVLPSSHSANTFAGITYKTKEGVTLNVKKPVLVAPESFDPSVYNTDTVSEFVFEPEADFNFISVGLGFDKNIGEDRKNLSTLVKWFCEAFAGNKNVGLILKCSMVGNSLMDFEMVKTRIAQLKNLSGCGEYPRIQLIHGRLSKKELASLYKHPKVKAYVTLTHGEGYGLPILEAAACGLPVIATNWSGHLDFLSVSEGRKRFVPVDYELKEIPESVVWKNVIERGTRWAYPKEEDAKTKMKKVYLSYDKPKEWAAELAEFLRTNFSEEKLGNEFSDFVDKFTSGQVTQEGVVEEGKSLSEKEKVYSQLGIKPGTKTLLYTMPMSAGDVFISTAVVDSLKKKFPDHLIYFATDQKYSGILKENPNIERTIGFENWMMNVPFLESIFDEVYTPNLAIQTTAANWVHGGKGRLLGDEIAAQCQVGFGEYFIKTEPVPGLPEKYIAFHPGSGKGQHEARYYRHWKKVVNNLRKMLPEYKIVTVGQEGDIHFEGCEDFRGRTNYNQLAEVIRGASCLVGIDSVSMHLAAAFETPIVALFGSSYSTSTGPVIKKVVHKSKAILIDTPSRMGCEKACYKYQCAVNKDSPCINEIDPKQVVKSVRWLVEGTENLDGWDEFRPKIAGYTHVFNAESHGFPYVQSIKSMLGFCDEVVVVDGGSTDGTVEKIQAIGDGRVKIYERKWDWNEPGMDGMQKAYGRAMANVGPDDFLWQQDADEVVHEADYEKIKKLVERFPSGADLVHLPVVELWGDGKTVRTDRHSWKWRLSRNNFRITHGINSQARVFDEKTGKTYARKNMSDGCEYVDVMTGEYIPHMGFYTRELEFVRENNPQSYGMAMNKIFNDLPSVFHYSWANLPRKIRNFKQFWNACWSNLYNDPAPVDRFPNVKTEEDVVKFAEELRERGGEHGRAKTFKLERSNPALMKDWLERDDAGGHIRNNQEQTGPAPEVVGLSAGEHGQKPVSTDGRS